MRLLVTGASGFVGRRFVAAARAKWSQAHVSALGGPGEAGGLDITDADAVLSAVRQAMPTHVVHLAAMAAVVDAARAPARAFAVNLTGTLNLVEVLRVMTPDVCLLHVSSAEVYGLSLRDAAGRPVDESASLQPANAYAASKAGADLLVQAAAAQGLRTTIARPFNHVGAGQSDAFVAPAFAAQIARAEAGLQPYVISVGELEDERDFLAVDDVINAYLSMLEVEPVRGRAVIYNIASGASLPIGDVLRRLLRLTASNFEIRVDQARLRNEPVSVYVGDASKIRRELDWRPCCDLNAALADVLADQRERIAASA